MASPMTSTSPAAGSVTANIAPAPATPRPIGVDASRMNTFPAESLFPSAGISTTKEWVLPPRPKPGRKPATDTPPTKRKAQNRAAQRAFRERRAARVGELEDELKHTEEEWQGRENALREQVERQQAEIQGLQTELRLIRENNAELQGRARQERLAKDAAIEELTYLRTGARSTGTDAVALPPRRKKQKRDRVVAITSTDGSNVAPTTDVVCETCGSRSTCVCLDSAVDLVAAGCGQCQPDHCQCLEEVVNGQPLDGPEALISQNPADPFGLLSNKKRTRTTELDVPMELDFTAQYSMKPDPARHRSSHDLASILNAPERTTTESCGFCDEGTFCVCAAAAAAAAASTTATGNQDTENRLAPLLAEFTPPPSDTDVTLSDLASLNLPSHRDSSIRKPIRRADPRSCTGEPGTCQQCQEDPKSGLFCRSLAATMSGSASSSGGCCGGNASGGCCKSSSSIAPIASISLEPSLSCADTYKTLASHKNFDRAIDDLGGWLPKLHPVAPRFGERGAMDIEAASVMSVLKHFDRRFGKGNE